MSAILTDVHRSATAPMNAVDLSTRVNEKNHRPAQTETNTCEKQEAQLSQRDHAMLRVTEYFTNSLQVTQDHGK